MINPANYYNPFAKYNYVSKTRGIYLPKDSAPLLTVVSTSAEKSSSIYSDNYDAQADIEQCMNIDENNNLRFKLFNFIGRIFTPEDKDKA